jgi:hypothetical protein
MKAIILTLIIVILSVIGMANGPLKYSDFKLSDEEYIDDIPFNTENIVYNIQYGSIRTQDDIKLMPERNLPYIISTFDGIYKKDTGFDGIRGFDADHLKIYIDGIVTYGGYNIPEMSIDKCSLIGGGVNR